MDDMEVEEPQIQIGSDYFKQISEKMITSMRMYTPTDVFDKNMVRFLHDSLTNIIEITNQFKDCTQSQIALLQAFIHFVDVFWKKAAYWAKQQQQEEEEEVIKCLLFATMMLEFIPCALDVTTCYLDILRSTTTENFQSIPQEETVESFVDFFFGHLDIILKDDFLLLRDRLVYFFNFIIDHPHKNIKEEEEEEDLIIRRQIFALFREHAYLLLSFDEMKEDLLNNNNMILRDFIIKIEIANANLRERYYVSSYSLIGSEALKIDYVYFVLVQRVLSSIEKHTEWAPQVLSQLKLYGMELRFLRNSLLWFVTLDEEIMACLRSVIVSLGMIWGSEEDKGFLAARLDTIQDILQNGIHWLLNYKEKLNCLC